MVKHRNEKWLDMHLPWVLLPVRRFSVPSHVSHVSQAPTKCFSSSAAPNRICCNRLVSIYCVNGWEFMGETYSIGESVNGCSSTWQIIIFLLQLILQFVIVRSVTVMIGVTHVSWDKWQKHGKVKSLTGPTWLPRTTLCNRSLRRHFQRLDSVRMQRNLLNQDAIASMFSHCRSTKIEKRSHEKQLECADACKSS